MWIRWYLNFGNLTNAYKTKTCSKIVHAKKPTRTKTHKETHEENIIYSLKEAFW